MFFLLKKVSPPAPGIFAAFFVNLSRPAGTINRRPARYPFVMTHVLSLHRWLALVVLAGLSASLSAQERKLQHKPFIDERRFHYGFCVGLHDQSLSLQNNGYIDPATGQQWMAENDTQNFGFSVGVLGEWRMGRYLALRLTPGMHFGSKHLAFVERGSQRRQSQDMKSTYVSLAAGLKAAAPRFNNYRPYVLAGASYMYDLTSGKHTLLRTKPSQTFLEVGMGCDLYLPFFKFIPELKFCFGLGNVLQKNRRDLTDSSQLIYTQSVDRAVSHMVVLSFYFE